MAAAVCSGMCGLPGCEDGSASTCCPATCLGGCNTTGHCYACADGHLRQDDGSCATDCPPGQLQAGLSYRHPLPCYQASPPDRFPRGPAEDPSFCVKTCPTGTYNDSTALDMAAPSCVAYCPGNEEPADGVCPSLDVTTTVGLKGSECCRVMALLDRQPWLRFRPTCILTPLTVLNTFCVASTPNLYVHLIDHLL
jgi:hypothetical protein